MKAILLLLLGTTVLMFTGCESDVPRDPNRPAVVFGNDQFRDDSADRPAERAMDREKTAW
ncbi:MAG: hypothetical protein ABI318_20730 [Chthoniobacteraceae bacterium]